MKVSIFILSLASFCLGLFLIIMPAGAIEIQRRFYASINWKIEPISQEKELRNTRLMGVFLIAVVILALILSQKPLFIK
jgi:hypothetical protein